MRLPYVIENQSHRLKDILAGLLHLRLICFDLVSGG